MKLCGTEKHSIQANASATVGLDLHESFMKAFLKAILLFVKSYPVLMRRRLLSRDSKLIELIIFYSLF